MKNEATPARSFKFPKSERLNSKKLIQLLFEEGSHFFLYPFKVYHLRHPDVGIKAHQVLVTTSSRRYKKAVERNLIKRRMREAYRLNKHLVQEVSVKLMIGYIYVGKEIHDFSLIRDKLKETLVRLTSKHNIKSPDKNE